MLAQRMFRRLAKLWRGERSCISGVFQWITVQNGRRALWKLMEEALRELGSSLGRDG
jgi:uncharacterized protein YjiS (DUF1127 family)